MKNVLTFTLLFCIGLFTQAAGQRAGEIGYEDISEWPKGSEGQHLKALIEAYNSNDAARITKFLEKHCTKEFQEMVPMERHVQVFQETYRGTGGLSFHSIRKYTPAREGEVVVVLKDEYFDSWRAIVLEYEEGGDKKIASLGFNGARTPSNVTEGPLSEAQMLEQVEKVMKRLKDKDAFSGTLLIAKNDKVLYEFVCGEASKRFHVPNNIDTKFNLGSMNKMFTSTAIMQLVEKNKVSLDDPISKYLDESWLPKSITDKVTVHHLLTHTSGLGSYFNQKYWETSREMFRQLDDYKPLVIDETLAFEPGERFRYSNTGMFLLGVIIEKASGENYFDYIREKIHKPAGMKNSDCYEMDMPVENLAIGYVPNNSQWGWENNIYKHVLKGGPAGGGFSTVRDLHQFALALTSGKLVSQKSLDKMWQSHSDANYGYGFSIEQHPSGKVVGHSGGFPGLNSNLDIILDNGYIVSVMSNYDSGASPVARKVLQMINRLKDI